MSFDMVEWQRRDPESGLIQPWFTHPALDEIQTWDLTHKDVLEWGGGHSTLWWASRCAFVATFENKPEWAEWIRSHRLANVMVKDQSWEEAARDPFSGERFLPDIVVIDGVARLECLKAALTLPRPLTIIFDNWQQDFVFISPEAEALMEPFREYGKLYVQPGHTNIDADAEEKVA